MRIWYDEWAREVRYLPAKGYPNGKVTHQNFIVRLNGHVMSMVTHADTEKGTVTFHDSIGGDLKTKTGNVSILAVGEGHLGAFSHMGPPITAVAVQRGIKYR